MDCKCQDLTRCEKTAFTEAESLPPRHTISRGRKRYFVLIYVSVLLVPYPGGDPEDHDDEMSWIFRAKVTTRDRNVGMTWVRSLGWECPERKRSKD